MALRDKWTAAQLRDAWCVLTIDPEAETAPREYTFSYSCYLGHGLWGRLIEPKTEEQGGAQHCPPLKCGTPWVAFDEDLDGLFYLADSEDATKPVTKIVQSIERLYNDRAAVGDAQTLSPDTHQMDLYRLTREEKQLVRDLLIQRVIHQNGGTLDGIPAQFPATITTPDGLGDRGVEFSMCDGEATPDNGETFPEELAPRPLTDEAMIGSVNPAELHWNFRKMPAMPVRGRRVAVLDTGYRRPKGPRVDSAVRVLSTVPGEPSGVDGNGHGTLCISAVSGVLPGGDRTGPCSDANILSIQVMSARGTGFDRDSAAGVRLAIALGADVISCSFGSPSTMILTEAALAEAAGLGILCLAAAGNSATTNPLSPARHPSVICVGSCNANGDISRFSERGPRVDVWAVGTNIRGFNHLGQTVTWSGTSAACPLAAAIMLPQLDGIRLRALEVNLSPRLYLNSIRPRSTSTGPGMPNPLQIRWIDPEKLRNATQRPQPPEAPPVPQRPEQDDGAIPGGNPGQGTQGQPFALDLDWARQVLETIEALARLMKSFMKP